jgi:hypothetical protein
MGSIWLAVKEVNGNNLDELKAAFKSLPFEKENPL